jgi:surface protein
MFVFFRLFEYFGQGSSFRLLFLRVDRECNRSSILATVFYKATVFNVDLNQWDVAEVTDMSASKSIRIVENDLTWRELVLL